MRATALRLIVITALAGLTFTVGCDSQPKTSDRNLVQINDRQLNELLGDSRARTLLLDPRPAERFAQGHIPGAVNIPLQQIVAGDPRLGQARNIVVYGAGWSDPLSPAAAKRLMAVGYVGVVEYRGGIEQWRSTGRALASAEPAAP